MNDVRVRKHFAHPPKTQSARDWLARERPDDDGELVRFAEIRLRELDEIRVTEMRRKKFSEDEPARHGKHSRTIDASTDVAGGHVMPSRASSPNVGPAPRSCVASNRSNARDASSSLVSARKLASASAEMFAPHARTRRRNASSETRSRGTPAHSIACAIVHRDRFAIRDVPNARSFSAHHERRDRVRCKIDRCDIETPRVAFGKRTDDARRTNERTEQLGARGFARRRQEKTEARHVRTADRNLGRPFRLRISAVDDACRMQIHALVERAFRRRARAERNRSTQKPKASKCGEASWVRRDSRSPPRGTHRARSCRAKKRTSTSVVNLLRREGLRRARA